MFSKLRFKILLTLGLFLLIPFFVFADKPGQKENFFVDSAYDLSGREAVPAVLKRIGKNLYFYVDEDWYKPLNFQEKQMVHQSLQNMDYEFYSNIYPCLTSFFGTEYKPGIDQDEKITVLIHPMKENVSGYFNSADEYPKMQVSESNEREMIYLNSEKISLPLANSFLAHEFMHLITFNQKQKKRGVQEEIWLNEARSEYAPSLCGYDDKYEGSYLQNRVEEFLKAPSDSLTGWQNQTSDYGALNLFTQYLVEHYGIEILIDSLHSKKTGISSINYALENQGYNTDFAQVFTDWTIAVLVNDCSLAPLDSKHLTRVADKYCYKNKNLKEILVSPLINFLPLTGESSLGVTQITKNWSGNWFKFVGGRGGVLGIKFIGNPDTKFRVPYVIKDIAGRYSLDFLQLDDEQKGEIFIPEFRTNIISATIIPSIQAKFSGFNGPEPGFSFFWQVSTKKETKLSEEPIRESLLIKIEELKIEIEKIKLQIQIILLKKQILQIKTQIDKISTFGG